MPDDQVNPTPLRRQTPSLAYRLISRFIKIGLALNRHDRKMAGSNGLGLTQTRILEFLRQCPKQSARLSAIAREFSITPATACESLRTLTQKGLVRKVRSETDERVVNITLSAKGHRKLNHAARQDGFLTAAAESLPLAEQEALFKTLRKLELAIQERWHAPASTMSPTCRDFQPHMHPDLQRSHSYALLDAPFGNRQPHIDYPENQPATTRERQKAWTTAEGRGLGRGLPQHAVLNRSRRSTTRVLR